MVAFIPGRMGWTKHSFITVVIKQLKLTVDYVLRALYQVLSWVVTMITPILQM